MTPALGQGQQNDDDSITGTFCAQAAVPYDDDALLGHDGDDDW